MAAAAPVSRSTSVLASDLRVAVTRLQRRLRSERAVGALTAGRLAALITLDGAGPLSPSALAEHERVQPPSMTRIIASLEEEGFIRRSPHPSDRRQFVLSLTDKGKQTVSSEQRRKEAWLARQLATLSEKERSLIAAALPVIERIAAGS